MLLSELVIIYLAAAAPFGVARFVEDRERGAGALARSAAAALAWPATALLFVLRNIAHRNGEAEAGDEGRAPDLMLDHIFADFAYMDAAYRSAASHRPETPRRIPI